MQSLGSHLLLLLPAPPAALSLTVSPQPSVRAAAEPGDQPSRRLLGLQGYSLLQAGHARTQDPTPPAVPMQEQHSPDSMSRSCLHIAMGAGTPKRCTRLG